MNLTQLAEIGKVVSGIFLPIVAAIGSLIAFQQYQITKTKLRFDLYQRRFDIYKVFVIFATKVVDGDEIKSDDYRSLRDAYYFAQFLFKPSVYRHLQDFINESKKLRKMRATQSNEESISTQEKEIIDFFTKENDTLFMLFSPYLSIKT